MSSSCNSDQCKQCGLKQNGKKGISMYPTLNAVPDDLSPISSVFLVVTQACNLKCKYCFVHQKPKNMSFDTALKTVEVLVENAKMNGREPSINFFGGEPLLRWKDLVKPLIEYIREEHGERFQLSMTTNGMLLDREKLEFLKENNVGLLFSMDGDKCTQDLNRPTSKGTGSFDTLVNVIPDLLEFNPNITFRSTTDNDNISEFVANHRFAVEKGFKSIFNIVNVFKEWSEEERVQLKEAIDELGDYYFELKSQGKNVDFQPFGSMFGKLNRIENALASKKYRVDGEDLLANGRCGLGATVFASVGVDGTMYSCQEMVGNGEYGDMFSIGNIYDGVDNEKRLMLAKSFSTKNVVNASDPEKCKECPMDIVCDGACVINNYFVNEDFHQMPDILCFYYRTLLEKAHEIKQKIENVKSVNV